jgi:hypothetical protein
MFAISEIIVRLNFVKNNNSNKQKKKPTKHALKYYSFLHVFHFKAA